MKPAVDMPDAYAGGQLGYPVASTNMEPEWWQLFGDPQLAALVEAAAGNSPRIAEARAAVREARAARMAAAAGWRPNLGTAASFTRQQQSENALNIPEPITGIIGVSRPFNLYEAGFDAQWELDVFGETARQTEAAEARREAAVENLRAVRVTLFAEVARAYIELRGAQQERAVARNLVEIQTKSLARVQAKERTGLSTPLDVSQAEAQLRQAEARLPAFETRIRAAAYRLGVHTGQMPLTLWGELEPPRNVPLPEDSVPISLPAALLQRRPDVRAAERQLHAASADIGAATAALYPSFNISGAMQLASISFGDFFAMNSRAFNLSPAIEWPIYQGGALRANITAAEARYDQAYARFHDSVLRALEEVEASLAAYGESWRTLARSGAAASAAGKAFRLANKRYEAGLEEFLTVLEANEALNETERARASAKTNAAVNLVRLYKALGGGWEPFEPQAPQHAPQPND